MYAINRVALDRPEDDPIHFFDDFRQHRRMDAAFIFNTIAVHKWQLIQAAQDLSTVGISKAYLIKSGHLFGYPILAESFFRQNATQVGLEQLNKLIGIHTGQVGDQKIEQRLVMGGNHTQMSIQFNDIQMPRPQVLSLRIRVNKAGFADL